jgi:hypothetical protein
MIEIVKTLAGDITTIDEECPDCGVPVDEICHRCGCDCDGHGGFKTMRDYCERGCKTAHGDSADITAEDEAAEAQMIAENLADQDERDLELAA